MTEQFRYTDERFADIQMLRYRLDGFEALTLRQKLYIYYLAKATLCGRDITTDQFGRYNLRIRKVLETIYKRYEGDRTTEEYKALETYLKRVWFSNGIHHHYGCEKFVPAFTEEYFRQVVDCCGCEDENIDELCKVIFDPTVLPKRVNQKAGDDLVQTSACNYYDGVTQQEAERFYDDMRDENDPMPISYGLNSTLRKTADGTLKEDVWHEGGLYGEAIKHITYWLEKASEVAENELQTKIIGMLVDYYRTGDLSKFDAYSIEWLKEHEGRIDFINGFIEVYGDPLGMKASWEGIVTYKDLVATQRTQTISRNAQWFEDHSPVDPRFRKSQVVGVTANVVCSAMLGGDEYPSTAIGINLPNADWIRARYGSKSITIGNLTHAYNQAAKGNGFLQEFVADEATRAMIEKYGDVCDDLHTDLHECLGHGSGQLLAGVSADALGSYGSTIEEARADLFGLYYIADAKLVELGLVPDAEAYKSQYYTYMMNGLLTQLTRIQPGNEIEEAHMRNRALIARWTLEHYPSAVRLVKYDDKTYVEVSDYEMLREAFAKLLAEIQRIKSEGDFEAAKLLVEHYAIYVEPKLHEELLARYKSLGIAPYKGFLNPKMEIVSDSEGNATDVRLDYTEAYDEQMLRYSSEYGFL
ncbi:dipeptidyl-peptidase 3 family protein [Leyella stercorea]|uniref:dipeptidyl-peptidase 3 family protein n=1 Tax=Leyella stercorea TaxID=363265 RepID=UPI001A42468C|nr:dihydrofolate reductase [Leyella stercorea]MBL6518169.1 dihydrofolate reductase [Leyella stercorea]